MAEKQEKKEEQKNCAGCKKALAKSKRYYRNGVYYCNKNCFNNKMKGVAEKAS